MLRYFCCFNTPRFGWDIKKKKYKYNTNTNINISLCLQNPNQFQFQKNVLPRNSLHIHKLANVWQLTEVILYCSSSRLYNCFWSILSVNWNFSRSDLSNCHSLCEVRIRNKSSTEDGPLLLRREIRKNALFNKTKNKKKKETTKINSGRKH